MNATRVCCTPDCDRPVSARGMCTRCYGRAYRAGEIQPALKVGIHSLAEVDVGAETAICAICGPTWIRVRTDGRGHECESKRGRYSRQWRVGERRAGSLEGPDLWRWQKYKLTPERHAEMWLDQDGHCQICRAEVELVVDHCHATGRVRGLLCHRCNVALGWLDDDVERIRAAADYVQRNLY